MYKIVLIQGGLGNQMFQYAMAKALRSHGHRVCLDISLYHESVMHNGYELPRVFGIKDFPIIDKQWGEHITWLKFLKQHSASLIQVKDNNLYNPEVLKSIPVYMNGYWQDERYFEKVDLTDCFQFQNIDTYNFEFAKELSNNRTVSVHIRRGDYLKWGIPCCEFDYYKRAVDYIQHLVENPTYVFFTDDYSLGEEIATQLGISYRIVNWNQKLDSYKDMFLMSRCRHNIIANSSFSWWAAKLNTNQGKIVVAPDSWMNNDPSFQPQCKDWVLL